MIAQDEKMIETDGANIEIMFRLIQYVSSPKTEPINLKAPV
jgi:hypothetical protein